MKLNTMSRFRPRLVIGASFVSAACIALFIAASQPGTSEAQPFDERQYPVADETVSKVIVPPPATNSTDEYLISLAKAGDVNFIADVTSASDEPVAAFPASPGAQHNKWQPKFNLVMLDFTQEKRFSLLRYNPDTFLFWREPEALPLARRLAASMKVRPEQKPVSAADLYKALVTSGVVPKDLELKGTEADIRVNELPAREREQVMQMIRLLLLERERASWAWFEDSFWESAFVRVLPIQVDGKTKSALQVAGFYLGKPAGDTVKGLHSP